MAQVAGSSVMVCITLGTGIGGGLVIGGRLFRGSYGMAGEWGHMISVPGGHWCECGNRGCWEQYASGNALVRDARAIARVPIRRRPTTPRDRRWRSGQHQRTRCHRRGHSGEAHLGRTFWPMSGPGSAGESPTSPPPWILRSSLLAAE